MHRLVTRLFVLALTLSTASGRIAHAGQPVVKTIAHDDSAHNSWANADRDKWRKKLLVKRSLKATPPAPLIRVRTR